MHKKLYIAGTILVILWILGYVVFGATGYFHLMIPAFFILFVLSENVRMRQAK